MACVLVVDDEHGVRESLRMLFKGDCEVATAGSVEEAERFLQQSSPDLILLDLVMPGRGGLDLLAALADAVDRPPVVVLTATKTVNTAVEAMKRGAVDYITKPFEVEALRIKVRQLLERRALEQELRELRAAAESRDRLGGLLGRSEAMQEVFRTIRRVAASRATVLIRGESGTGKELIARALHYASPRAAGPLVKVNCAALAESLLEAELFGHEKGAFTGAVASRKGRFELADGGSIFLDEIGDLPPHLQVKLLRVLQEREFERVGSSRPVKVDVRLLAATHRNLEALVRDGRFRDDLYYRINVVTIMLPPLRERREDLPPLIEHFLRTFAEKNGKTVRGVTREAREALLRYDYPGNIRELENLMERAVVLTRDDVIGMEDLPLTLEAPPPESGEGAGLIAAVEGLERRMIREALARAEGTQTRAAELLGISERVLRYKLRKYGLS